MQIGHQRNENEEAWRGDRPEGQLLLSAAAVCGRQMASNMLKRVSASQFPRHLRRRSAALDATKHLHGRIVQAEANATDQQDVHLAAGHEPRHNLLSLRPQSAPHQKLSRTKPCSSSCNGVMALPAPGSTSLLQIQDRTVLQDLPNMVLLGILYMMQGVPLGLTMGAM